jgi:hypothetical protein
MSVDDAKIKSAIMKIVKINFETAESLGLSIHQLHESRYDVLHITCLEIRGVGNLTSKQISMLQIKFRTVLLECFNDYRIE